MTHAPPNRSPPAPSGAAAAAPGKSAPWRSSRPATGEVLVRTLFSGISRGTETLVFRGAVPPSEHDRMRAPFQEGDFDGPVKYGYSNVGVVEAGPAALVGQTVFCLFPHQTRYVVPIAAVQHVPPPCRRSGRCWRPTWRRPSTASGMRGPASATGSASSAAAWSVCWSPGWRRRFRAARSNWSTPIPPGRRSPASWASTSSRVEEATPDADLVIHASGNPAGLRRRCGWPVSEATVLEMSWYGAQPVTLALGEAFHSRRLDLRSSQVGAIAPQQRARWSHARRLGLALALLADPRLDVLITGDTAFDDMPRLMARLAAGDPAFGNALCERVTYPMAAPA